MAIIDRSLTSTLTITQSVAHNFKFGTASSTLTVTQAALSDIQTYSLVDSLGLTQLASADTDHRFLSNTLSLTQTVVKQGPVPRSLSNQLAITHVASYDTLHRYVIDSLSLTQLAASSIRDLAVSQNLSLTQVATPTVAHTIEVSVVSSLNLGHYVLSPSSAPASNQLELSDSVSYTVSPLLAISQDIGLAQEVSTFGSIYQRPLVDIVDLSDEARRIAAELTITSTLSLTDLVEGHRGYKNDLDIQQLASVDVVKALSHTITITDSVSYDADVGLRSQQSLNIGQSAIPYVVRVTPTDCKPETVYSPTVTPGSTFPTTQPTVTPINTVVLKYPYTTPTLTLTLHCPEYDNTERHSYQRVIRDSRGGTQHVFRDASWPKSKKLGFEILLIERAKVDEFFDFLQQSLGQEVELIDHLSRHWRGVIVPNEGGVVQSTRGRRSMNLEFEGELV